MKRLLSAVLALALLLTPALCAPAAAADALPADDEVFYRQLSPAAREVFDLLNTEEGFARIRAGEPIEMRVEGTYGSEAELRRQINARFAAAAEAYAALLQCHPEIFWTKSCKVSGSCSYGGGSYTLPVVIAPQFENAWRDGGRDVSADEDTLRAAVQALGGEACIQGGPWSQLAYVHDWLTEHNVYNVDAARRGSAAGYLPWTPLAALTDETQPVCEGYARAFKLLCGELGYPCVYVAGYAIGPHAWNMVQVGGQWYAVDVTFDDPVVPGVTGVVSGQENRRYFLVGETTLLDDGSVFSDNHIPTGDISDSVRFTYPALAAEALDPSFSWSPDRPGRDEPEHPEPDWPGPAVFADVDDTVYYAPAVKWAVRAGVTNGTGTDAAGRALFSPDAAVTRAQAVTFLWRARGEPEPDAPENRFRDVAAGSYYEKAVLWAVENGITNGTAWDEESGVFTFSPDDPVTRGQMLTFLWRAMGRPGETEAFEGKAWNADAEAWAAEFGVADGTAQAYSAAADCPRGDVVYYLFHAVLLMAG